MNWSFPPDLQKRYEEILARTRQLQEQLGITPRTIEERCRDYEKRKEEEKKKAEEQQRIQEELKKLQQVIGQKRLPPKWKL